MTMLRHTAATLVSGVLGEEDRKDLADLMQHSTREQQKTYNDCFRTLKHVRISNILKKILTESEVSSADLKEAEFGKLFIANSNLITLVLYIKECSSSFLNFC